ncbi:MAG: TetR/AcrR family transcriptional regulator [Solirubrobacterales bacterium]
MLFAEHPVDRKSRTRVGLLRAMIEVGGAVGYANSSVQEVIAAAGVARSTFYAHFPDRDACFLAALDLLSDAAIEPGRAGGTVGAVRSLIEFAEWEPAGAKLLFVESLAGGEDALRRRERFRDRVEKAVIESETSESAVIPAGVSRAAIGGALRLLAMRMCRGDPDLRGLGEDLETWIRCYQGGPPARASFPAGSASGSGTVSSLETPSARRDGRHRLPPDELARSQRLRILRAIAACSSERGYSATRVADVTARAQVSRKAFYQHFHDKAEAATEANEGLFQAALSACAGAFFGSEAWPDRVWAGGSALLAFLAAHPQDSHLGFVEPHAIGPDAVRHVYDRLAAFTLFLEEGYRLRPEAEALPRAISEALAAGIFEFVFRELCERRDLERLILALPEFVYIILAPFIGPEAASEFIRTKVDAC